MGKIVYVQWLRAIACIGVVWLHATYLVKNPGLPSFQTSWLYLERIGAVGVDIFFVISGFIVTLSATRYPNARNFIVERFLRVWPLYAIATILFLVFKPSQILNASRLLSSLALLQPDNPGRPLPTLEPGWSLMSEMWFYLSLTAALALPSKRLLHERVTILIVGLIMIAAVSGFAHPLNIAGNPLGLEFLFGVWIASAWMRRRELPQWVCGGMFIAGAYLVLSTIFYGEQGVANVLAIMEGPSAWGRVRIWGIGSALVVASAVFRKPVDGSGGVLGFLGDASYSIYLFHIHALTWLGNNMWAFGGISPDMIILAGTAIATAFGVVAHMGIERPLMRRLRIWRKARSPGGSVVIEKSPELA